MSNSIRRVFQFLVVLLFAAMTQISWAAAEPSDAEKLQLKAVVFEHIKEHTDDNAYYFIDAENTDLKKFTFVAMHPVVFERSDGTYALCADFEDVTGKKVLVDYYVKNVNGRYVVLSSVAGKRSILMSVAEKFGL